MVDNSRFGQFCRDFCTAYAAFCSYPTVVVEPEGGDGFLITGHPGSADIRVFTRERDLHTSQSPPVIVIIPKRARIMSPDRVGSQKQATGIAEKAIRVRKLAMQFYCWGENNEVAEDLEHNALNALEQFHNSMNEDDEVWETEQTGASGQSLRGAQISFVATIDIQVTDAPQGIPQGTVKPAKLDLSLTELSATEETKYPS